MCENPRSASTPRDAVAKLKSTQGCRAFVGDWDVLSYRGSTDSGQSHTFLPGKTDDGQEPHPVAISAVVLLLGLKSASLKPKASIFPFRSSPPTEPGAGYYCTSRTWRLRTRQPLSLGGEGRTVFVLTNRAPMCSDRRPKRCQSWHAQRVSQPRSHRQGRFPASAPEGPPYRKIVSPITDAMTGTAARKPPQPASKAASVTALGYAARPLSTGAAAPK
eukprot:scaffold30_cov416-Prasinococcus_capsulatus_cf.AAC.28